ncbi:hypothetical protein B9Z19DRAFT_1133057 [Tuber borchii]|uniref:Uncharacterized protein n=1 Tax=Tuber borchii TaxID=42251 RepID=A0A2T6ZGF5_TUBBO|nr:hypothetical protein B9Z19DRAFT_1133057 [Tuber borchii]
MATREEIGLEEAAGGRYDEDLDGFDFAQTAIPNPQASSDSARRMTEPHAGEIPGVIWEEERQDDPELVHQQKYTMHQGVWKALSLNPDSGGVRYASAKPFDDVVLQHPICPPPKGRHHTSIFHGATESSEGGVHFGSVSYAIMEPFNDGVVRHPIYPPPKGRPHTSIFHGATESSEGGIPGALGMRSRSPLTTAFYAIPSIQHQKDVPIQILGAIGMQSRNPLTTAFYTIPSVHRQKGVPIRAFSMALHSLLKGGLLYQIPGALGMRSRSPLTMAFYAIPSVHHQKDVPIHIFSMALQSLLKGGSLY